MEAILIPHSDHVNARKFKKGLEFEIARRVVGNQTKVFRVFFACFAPSR